jgi:hypothetical protein
MFIWKLGHCHMICVYRSLFTISWIAGRFTPNNDLWCIRDGFFSGAMQPTCPKPFTGNSSWKQNNRISGVSSRRSFWRTRFSCAKSLCNATSVSDLRLRTCSSCLLGFLIMLREARLESPSASATHPDPEWGVPKKIMPRTFRAMRRLYSSGLELQTNRAC